MAEQSVPTENNVPINANIINANIDLYVDDIICNITKLQKKSLDAELNCANWKNLKDLITELINFDCEIFGGCPRDLVFREHWARKFYEYCDANNIIGTPDNYANREIHPESYKGRTTQPNDLDVFIKGNANFEKVKKHLNKKYKLKEITLTDDIEPHHPYFLETNKGLRNILTYYRFNISGYNICKEMDRLLYCMSNFLRDCNIESPSDNIEKSSVLNLFNLVRNRIDQSMGIIDRTKPLTIEEQLHGFYINIDIIVLEDNWKTNCDLEELSQNIDRRTFNMLLDGNNIRPQFSVPDFRCNQLSLVKKNNSNGRHMFSLRNYVLKANWNFINNNYFGDGDAGGIAGGIAGGNGVGASDSIISNALENCITKEIEILQQEAKNLKIITDDIIAQRAVAGKISIPPNRMLKMERKGYTIDVSAFGHLLYTRLGLDTQEDKCIICLATFTEEEKSKYIMKPCICSGLLHYECYYKVLKTNPGMKYYNCPNCRKKVNVSGDDFYDDVSDDDYVENDNADDVDNRVAEGSFDVDGDDIGNIGNIDNNGNYDRYAYLGVD